MATTKLKRLLGDAGAGIDASHGTDRLLDVLTALVEAHTELVTQFNQLRADFDAHVHGGVTAGGANTAAPTPTTATDLLLRVEKESP